MEINPERQLKGYNPSDYDNPQTLMLNIRRNLQLKPFEIFETQGILLQILSRFLKCAQHRYEITDTRIWKSIRYIRKNIDKEIELDTLAGISCLSKDHYIRLFKAEKFDAHEWVSLFKEAGAKYIVPVAEHHDGFAMYDSDLNPWNAVKMGPKKDIIGLLKTEAEKAGLVFGLSSHRLENAWFYNGGMLFPSDVQDSTLSIYGFRLPESDKYNDEVGLDLLAHTKELVNKYQPQLIWFDWTVGNEVIRPYFNVSSK